MSPTVAAAQPSTFEREFRAALAQRSDAGSPAAAYHAAARAAHALLAERWAATQAAEAKRGAARRVHYLSMEYLMGRALGNAVAALNLREPFAALLRSSPAVAAAVAEQEKDAALGNGGLGRLAACFLDAFATLGLPSFAYGLRYEQGIFAQRIADGAQVESPDDWLRDGNPWEHVRQELAYPVGFGGVVVSDGNARRWAPAETVVAKAHDFVVPGHHTEHVSTLRLWRAMAARPIDYAMFSRGEHLAAGEHLQRR
jgi:starch phosphorylase